MKKWLLLLPLILLLTATGCQSKTESDFLKVSDAYIEAFTDFYKLGDEYRELGLPIQAEYAYSRAAASSCSMRYAVDWLIFLKGGETSIENASQGRLSDWEKIAALNYSSPFPYFFEGLIYQMQDDSDKAQECYAGALVNPEFSADNDVVLKGIASLSIDELKSVRKKLVELEDIIFAVYTPKENTYPRGILNHDDLYLRGLARETLVNHPNAYKDALMHYESALSVNPYAGDNFLGCALMHLYVGDMDKFYYYVNEGIYADPEHEGLNEIILTLNKEGTNQ